MGETNETHFCFYHPNTPTSLRCNKCGKYICARDARRTPVGYRCKDCVRSQQDTFFNATPVDYVITAVIALPLALIAGSIVPRLGFLTIFGGPIVGIIISEIVRVATGKRRGRYTWAVAVGCLIVGTLIPVWPTIELLLLGVPDFITVILAGIYLALAAGTLVSRLRFGG